ncbi:MAG: Lrp/AsnC ligand binding domain-containing protein [Euryarchaeota archaeon]|nr:Lrp/AsnC ligand binding domain-containing protein [Euryarchaeota archaeon]
MVFAYVLIAVKPGKIDDTIKALKDIKGVEKVSAVYGEVDVVAELSATDLNSLRKVVLGQIHKIDGINKTTTLLQT